MAEPNSTRPQAARFHVQLAALCALLMPLPILWFNPDFAHTPIEWLELTTGAVTMTLLAAAGGAIAWRLGGASPGAGACWATMFWLIGALAAVGSIVTGVAGAALAALPFGVGGLAMLVRRRAIPPRPARATLIGTVASVVLLVAYVTGATTPETPRHQVVMIGLDGATWPIIDRLRAQGRLPTLDRLITQGARADLDTLSPVISPPIWTSIASGKTPDHHGVKDFWASANQVKAKRLWEIVDEQGLVSGVLGYLVTWPPTKRNGFLVPGWLAQGPETFPPELSFLKRLEMVEKSGAHPPLFETLSLSFAALSHGMTISTVNKALAFVLARTLGVQGELEGALSGRLAKLGLTTDVFCHLLRHLQPDLAIYYESSIDATEHLFFKYYEPTGFASVTPHEAASYGEAIPRIYEAADAAIARIVSAASPDATILVVSDHGQETAHTEGQQWYVIKTTTLLRDLGIGSGLRATNSGASVFLRATAPPSGTWPMLDKIRSVVTVPDDRPLFHIDERKPGEALLSVRAGLDPRSDTRARLAGHEIPLAALVEPSTRISGVHTSTAMLLLVGPDIVPGVRLRRGHILDVAPTVLAFLRLPVAHDMQGRVIKEAMRGGLRTRLPVGYVETYGEPNHASASSTDETLDQRTVEKLRTRGYVQ